MFKSLVTSLLILVSSFAWAQPVVVPQELATSPEAVALLKEKCVPACIVFSPEDWEQLMKKIELIIQERVKQGVRGSI